MKYKKILLTGGSGSLGHAIIKSGLFSNLLSPSSEILDSTNPIKIKKFFGENDFDAIIHCAALARMSECELNPEKAVLVNTIGTSNLVISTLEKEKKSGKPIRFIFISTDGVYPGTKGNYSEDSETIPYNKYGWTKLGAECAVNTLSNFCIIRTSFFDPENIKFEDAATDAYSSKVPIDYLVKSINTLLNSDFAGTMNIGRGRRPDYQHYKEFKPDIKKCTLKDILKTVPFAMAKDASMNISLWKRMEKEKDAKKLE